MYDHDPLRIYRTKSAANGNLPTTVCTWIPGEVAYFTPNPCRYSTNVGRFFDSKIENLVRVD